MTNRDNTDTPTEGAEETLEHAVFRGLSPRRQTFDSLSKTPGAVSRGFTGALPFVMTGSLATGAIAVPGLAPTSSHPGQSGSSGDHARDQRPGFADRLSGAFLPVAHSLLSAVRPDLPATYTVKRGDTVSSIADSFGIPTPAILTLNGLSWEALLHEGQVLKLSTEPTKKVAASPARVVGKGYVVQKGEALSTIASRLGISTQALRAENDLDGANTIYAGQVLRIPGTTSTVVERNTHTFNLRPSNAPTIIPASASAGNAVADDATSQPAESEVFDAADVVLADKPALITVKVEPTRNPTPAPKATPAAAPAPPPPSASVGQPLAGSITPLNDERRANAQLIINVGRELGVPDYGIVIALATAMQESSLRNINWGDRDSLGIFQQRPSAGWGSAEEIMDPAHATRLFFGGPSNPNKNKTRGLLDIAGWETMPLTVAAQRVQISAYPNAYAKWEPSAWAWLYELT